MRPSWFRELMSSFLKTLRRWYCTVRELMNSCAPISGLERPSRASLAICASCGVRMSRVFVGAPARVLSGGKELVAGSLRKRLRPDAAERLVRGSKLLARLEAPVLTTKPLAVHELRSRQLKRDSAAVESLDRLAV